MIDRSTLKALALSCLLFPFCGCHAGRESVTGPGRLVVVNAPATGEVKRVLVGEGVSVEVGAPIIEIAVQREEDSAPQDHRAEAAARLRAAQSEVEAARAEVVKHEAEVQRLAPLVASGQATQAQLDAERALYEQAQRRLQHAQEAQQSTMTDLVIAQREAVQPSPAYREDIVVARAPVSGTLRVVGVKAGQRVIAGQPLATISSDAP